MGLYFLRKLLLVQFLEKNCQKWSQNGVLAFFNFFYWIFLESPCQKKFWFLSYGPNCSDRIKLQDSLESNIL